MNEICYYRFQHKKVVGKRKNMLIRLNDKLQNILMRMEHLKNVYQQWKKIKGKKKILIKFTTKYFIFIDL